jgi:hypothetical protein
MAGMCALVPASCCGRCGAATWADHIALPRESAADYREQACGTDAGSGGCPDCAGLPDVDLQAFCRDGACATVDVRNDPISSCSSDDDCVAVHGVCCGPCDSERGLVAINKTRASEFKSQICDPRVDCAGCPPPASVTVVCDYAVTKHCMILRPL